MPSGSEVWSLQLMEYTEGMQRPVSSSTRLPRASLLGRALTLCALALLACMACAAPAAAQWFPWSGWGGGGGGGGLFGGGGGGGGGGNYGGSGGGRRQFQLLAARTRNHHASAHAAAPGLCPAETAAGPQDRAASDAGVAGRAGCRRQARADTGQARGRGLVFRPRAGGQSRPAARPRPAGSLRGPAGNRCRSARPRATRV